MITIEDWCDYYRRRPDAGIVGSRTSEGKCKVATGGTFHYAEVKLEFSPSKVLDFSSELSGEQRHEADEKRWHACIYMGLLDVMLIRPLIPVTVFRCVVKSIKTHEVDSTALAFCLAGRDAAATFLDGEPFS